MEHAEQDQAEATMVESYIANTADKPIQDTTYTQDVEMTFDPYNTSSTLFRLPRELRQQIYTLLLSSHPLGITWPCLYLDRGLSPQLLRTCRTIRAEASAVLYGNKMIFSHPTDANIWVQAYSDTSVARDAVTDLVFRVKVGEVKLWTSYFNSNSECRSLIRDFPQLGSVTIRYRGPRYMGHLGMGENCHGWLRDKGLLELATALRKCQHNVSIEICVKLPDGWAEERAWDVVLENAVRVSLMASAQANEGDGQPRDYRIVRRNDSVLWEGVWIRIETEGT